MGGDVGGINTAPWTWYILIEGLLGATAGHDLSS